MSKCLPDEHSVFVGYDALECDARILYREEAPPTPEGHDCHRLVLDRTPFYAERGGQVSDTGTLAGEGVQLRVVDVQHAQVRGEPACVHHCEGELEPEAVRAQAQVARARRRSIMANHTGAHLMVAAMRERLGADLAQAGSLVCPDYLRFDFTCRRKLDQEDLQAIEDRVNAIIMENLPVNVMELPREEALARGAVAMDDAEYGDVVRMVEVESFSRELCGGTHAVSTGTLGSLRITSQEAMGKGLRRLHAVTGRGALALARREAVLVKDLMHHFSCTAGEILERVRSLGEERQRLSQELGQVRAALAARHAEVLAAQQEASPAGFGFVVEQVEAAAPAELQGLVDAVASRLPEAVVLLGSVLDDQKVTLIAVAGTQAQAAGARAGDLVRLASEACGGRGGGRPNRAQGGGRDPALLGEALTAARTHLRDLGQGG